MKSDGYLKSPWQNTSRVPEAGQPLDMKAVHDVVIVGAGITRCSTALELAKAGKKCLLIEAHDIGVGTTGGTTAHFNTVLDHSYAQITSGFGLSASRLVAKGSREALDLVAANVNELGIHCGHSWREGFLFGQNNDQTGELEEIFRATKEAGVNVLALGEGRLVKLDGEQLGYTTIMRGSFTRSAPYAHTRYER